MGGDATAASGSDMRARADGARDVICSRCAHRRAGGFERRSINVQATRQSVASIAKNHHTQMGRTLLLKVLCVFWLFRNLRAHLNPSQDPSAESSTLVFKKFHAS